MRVQSQSTSTACYHVSSKLLTVVYSTIWQAAGCAKHSCPIANTGQPDRVCVRSGPCHFFWLLVTETLATVSPTHFKQTLMYWTQIKASGWRLKRLHTGLWSPPWIRCGYKMSWLSFKSLGWPRNRDKNGLLSLISVKTVCVSLFDSKDFYLLLSQH